MLAWIAVKPNASYRTLPKMQLLLRILPRGVETMLAIDFARAS